MTATTAAFDPAVTSATGDLWLESLDPTAGFAPVVVDPGQTRHHPGDHHADGGGGDDGERDPLSRRRLPRRAGP